jgi:hypothetical protein
LSAGGFERDGIGHHSRCVKGIHQPHAYIEPTIPMANAAIARPQEGKQEGQISTKCQQHFTDNDIL